MICENGQLRVEVIIVLLFFSFMLTDSIYTNLVIYRTCYVTLGYNKTECALLGSLNKDNKTAELEKIVEPYADTITMAKSIAENLFTALLCLFIGPWSDKFGRKPLIVSSLIGFVIANTIIIVFTVLPNLSPWYIVVASVPVCLTGGGAVFISGTLAHITDSSNEHNRGFRMGVFEAMIALGIFLGQVCSSYAFSATGYTGVFGMTLGIVILALILTVFFVPETLENKKTEGHIREFFKTDNLVEMWKTTTKKRTNFNRGIILLIILMLSIYIFAINGDGSVVFLYVRDKFHWSLRQHTLVGSVGSILWIVGTICSIFLLHKLLKLSEGILILIGFISMSSGHLLSGLATKDWHIYVANIVRCLGGMLSPMCRTLASKIIPNDEIGKIFAMIITGEFLMGIFGAPLYTLLYNKTINIDPAIFCYFTAAIYGFESLLTLLMIALQRMKPSESQYSQLNNEETDITEPVA